jgi:uncharacterized membrane protein
MGDLNNAKIFGGIGSILMLVGGFIPLAGAVLPFIGLILVLIAVYYIGTITKDESIFKNYILSFILQIVAVVAFVAIMAIAFGATFGFSLLEIQNMLESQAGVTDPTDIFGNIGALIGGCCLAGVIAWVLMIISALFLKKSFSSIKEHLKVDIFGTTGLVYLIGAALLIIGIGGIVLLIALILQIIAFFSLPDQPPAAAKTPEEST